ncbi:hypothetical protein [Pontibacter litorisediminis]|uniref:hypothetical protein n=1 Tax=Pontibacter litorisediminis TaxID=1846260 RepID=UPI0023EAF740|nr:hypothetical protein [Pontibacter litorisediminis]
MILLILDDGTQITHVAEFTGGVVYTSLNVTKASADEARQRLQHLDTTPIDSFLTQSQESAF